MFHSPTDAAPQFLQKLTPFTQEYNTYFLTRQYAKRNERVIACDGNMQIFTRPHAHSFTLSITGWLRHRRSQGAFDLDTCFKVPSLHYKCQLITHTTFRSWCVRLLKYSKNRGVFWHVINSEMAFSEVLFSDWQPCLSSAI